MMSKARVFFTVPYIEQECGEPEAYAVREIRRALSPRFGNNFKYKIESVRSEKNVMTLGMDVVVVVDAMRSRGAQYVKAVRKYRKHAYDPYGGVKQGASRNER